MSKHHNPSGWFREKLRAAVLKRDKLCRRCAAAGRATIAVEADHIIPKHKGGSDAMTNMQGLCRDCHRIKTAEDLGKVAVAEFDRSGWPTDPMHPWNRVDGQRDRNGIVGTTNEGSVGSPPKDGKRWTIR